MSNVKVQTETTMVEIILNDEVSILFSRIESTRAVARPQTRLRVELCGTDNFCVVLTAEETSDLLSNLKKMLGGD